MTQDDDNGRRHAWRLRVHLPTLDPERDPELFQWVRFGLMPIATSAPRPVTIELLAPEDDP